MTTSEHIITPLVKPHTRGIIWATKEALELETAGVYEINYLLNGLLIQSLESGLSHPEKNLFLSQNFGSPFFIGHVTLKNQNQLDSLYNHLNIVKDQLSENSEILFLCESDDKEVTNLYENLTKKFSEFKFHLKNIVD